jgi:hypothetical protein
MTHLSLLEYRTCEISLLSRHWNLECRISEQLPKCYSLDLECPSKFPVLKDWSPVMLVGDAVDL